MTTKTEIIAKGFKTLRAGMISEAKVIISENYPFKSMKKEGRTYREHQKMKIFLRDGFTDRYSGERLVFPPVLRIMSSLMPEEFPFHRNWKTSDCHLAYWHLMPTIDHIIPISRGGPDEESNWVCTSQLRNSAKSSWLLEELGWQLHKAGDLKDWDGLLASFMEYIAVNPGALADGYINSWYVAAKRANGK
ncbi:MAG TPA: HNH endonuclease signature motif containing protein [Smithella sp.]|mgnify:FL=1|nr:HNH endonuclease signature motif containing protein [Smithella sp.]